MKGKGTNLHCLCKNKVRQIQASDIKSFAYNVIFVYYFFGAINSPGDRG